MVVLPRSTGGLVRRMRDQHEMPWCVGISVGSVISGGGVGRVKGEKVECSIRGLFGGNGESIIGWRV